MQGIPDLELIKRMSANAEAISTLRRINLVSLGILAAIAVVVLTLGDAASP
jgi:hypothetical protein